MDGQAIKTWREQLGVSQEHLAIIANTKQQTVQRIESGQTKHSRSNRAIEAALEELTEVRAQYADLKGMDLIKAAIEKRVSDFDKLALSKGTLIRGKNADSPDTNMPVPLHMASTTEGNSLQISPQPLRQMSAHEYAINSEGTYAFYIPSQAYAPVFGLGDFVFANPNIPPTQGSLCIVMTANELGGTALIGSLFEIQDEYLTLLTFKGEPVKLNRAEWPRCDRIIGRFLRF